MAYHPQISLKLVAWRLFYTYYFPILTCHTFFFARQGITLPVYYDLIDKTHIHEFSTSILSIPYQPYNGICDRQPEKIDKRLNPHPSILANWLSYTKKSKRATEMLAFRLDLVKPYV